MKQISSIYYKSKLGTVRASEIKDVFELADNLRMDDIAEIYNSHHKTPETALMDGYINSILCLSIERQERVIGMFGIVPHTILGNAATIWLLGSPEIEKVQKAFIRHSKRFVDMFLGYYPYLENWVSCQNILSIKWLRWLKADIEPAMPYGIEGQFFRHFYFRRE